MYIVYFTYEKNKGKIHINKQIHMHYIGCFWERKLGVEDGRESFQNLIKEDLWSFNSMKFNMSFQK